MSDLSRPTIYWPQFDPAFIDKTAASLDATKVELLAEALRRCMGIDANDNARHDFGDINGGSLQRPSEVAAELLRALADEGLTLAVLRGGSPDAG